MSESLAKAYARAHPAKAAAKLVGYETAEIIEFLASLDPAVEASVLARLNNAKAATVLNTMPSRKVAALITEASHDDGLTLISYLQPSRYPDLVEAAENSKQVKQRLYGYSARSLGAIASPEFLAIEKGTLVSDVRHELDSVKVGEDLPVFVVKNNQLLGRLPLMPLLINSNSDRHVEDLMVACPSLPARATVSAVMGPELWQEHQLLPVVDKDERLIGIVSRRHISDMGKEPVEANVGIEEITRELAASYVMVCSNLLDELVGVRK